MPVAPELYLPPVDAASEFVGPPTDATEDRIEVGVAIVGGGPAGLACAIKIMQLLERDPELAEQLNLAEAKGVLVAGVEPGGPAQEAGVRRGDVILEVDRRKVGDVDELTEVLEKAERRALLYIRRGESQLYVPLKRKAG